MFCMTIYIVMCIIASYESLAVTLLGVEEDDYSESPAAMQKRGMVLRV